LKENEAKIKASADDAAVAKKYWEQQENIKEFESEKAAAKLYIN